MGDDAEQRDPRRIVRGSIAVAIVLGVVLLLAAGGFWWAGGRAGSEVSSALAWACAVLGLIALATAPVLRLLDPWREEADRGAGDAALADHLEELGDRGGISAEQLERAKAALQRRDRS